MEKVIGSLDTILIPYILYTAAQQSTENQIYRSNDGDKKTKKYFSVS